MTRGEKVIAFIETYCRAPEGELVGQPIVLEDFQKNFILDVYDGEIRRNRKTRRAILCIARKNGKTALIAALVLVHLVGPEAKQNSQIVSGAMSRDQAAAVFNLACKMINFSPELRGIVHIVPTLKKLVGRIMNTEYQALASDAKTKHGLSPVVAILDETGQLRGAQDEFIDAIVTAQGAHADPLLFVISTQAANDADLLSLWIDDAKRDEDTVCHVHAASREADVMDEDAWHAANPALGKFRSIDDMRSMAEKASRMPSFENTFRNLYLNQRISVHAPFISRNVWEACAGEPVPIEDCEEVYGALDLSARTDLTSYALIGKLGGLYHARVYFWTPEQGLFDRAKRDRAPYDAWVKQGFIETVPGASIDYEFIAHRLGEINSGLNLKALAYDRWRMDVLKKELDRIGLDLPLVEWGQGFKDMGPAVDALEQIILNQTLRHGGNPVLTMCMNNISVVRSPANDRKFDKSKATGRIDGGVALAMAAGIADRMFEGGLDIDMVIASPLIL